MPTITYPLSPPAIAGIGPQDFTLAMENVVGENISPFTLSEQEQQWPGQMFTIDANLPPMMYQQAEQWIAWGGSLFGKYGNFLMGDYNRPAPQGNWYTAPLVNGANPSGANVINLRNAAGSTIVAGDYIQITAFNSALGINVQRIYKMLANAVLGGIGPGTVSMPIFPSIREPLTDGQAIVTANCAGTFRLQQNSFTWKIDKNRMYTISFKAREALLP